MSVSYSPALFFLKCMLISHKSHLCDVTRCTETSSSLFNFLHFKVAALFRLETAAALKHLFLDFRRGKKVRHYSFNIVSTNMLIM